jgi:DGQHR domain-containing protein
MKRSSQAPDKPTTPLVVRALRTKQGAGADVYSFFIKGADLTRIADISRLERDENDALRGFQRKEIRDHVRNIVQYLDHVDVLFPNAIILALSSDVRFTASRGPKPPGLADIASSGTLRIPIRPEGERVAWIVDGQQRSLALAESKNKSFPVPVVAFVSDDLGVQREQFILVNKAKPLPNRLINELLPETSGVFLPKDLTGRKIPSELCGLLNRDPTSPFHQLIRRPSDPKAKQAVITDTAVIRMIRNSLNSPLGALAPFKQGHVGSPDVKGMYGVLLDFWSCVADVFQTAWGLSPSQSRLSHSAGIEAMGVLMDKILARRDGAGDIREAIRRDLKLMAPFCRWTGGQWEDVNVAWNAIENTPRDIRLLAETLVRLYVAKVAR